VTFPGGPRGGNLNLAVAQGSNVGAFAGIDNVNGTDVGNAAFNIANDPGTSLFEHVPSRVEFR
jgi:hypothetical protein